MVQVLAKPGPGTISKYSQNVTAATWIECMKICFADGKCATVYFLEATKQCTKYWMSALTFLNRTEESEGHRIAIKIPLSKRSCSLTTEQLLHNQYYMYYPYVFTFMKRIYIGIRTSPKYYAITSFKDDLETYMPYDLSCPKSQLTSWAERRATDNSSVCYSHIVAPGITQLEAKELCELQGMKLLIERYEGMIPMPDTQRLSQSVLLTTPFEPDFGFVGIEDVRTWFGLERDPVDRTWKWSETSFIYMGFSGNPPMTWAPGEPKEVNNCAYLQRNDATVAKWPGYAFFSAPCNSTDVGGFSCGSVTQSARGIPTWNSLVAEYGHNQTCCVPDAETRIQWRGVM
ncbi:C-type lectin domain-containing protein [Caenorhabditis elegans]|nr:C-type lectin domain-containing protein [Caenorhabditis elegans]CAB54341.2 C-type lectin domain-containing protein [Caenorhabditis elegans]|eukprot:NP_493286.2 C-type LECtin [Caenorhabditis elegans]